jgi:hypothetical protein
MIRNAAGRQAQETGEEPALEGSAADIDALFVTCIPAYPGEFATDACGGEPCEDAPDPGEFHSIVLECSRDPYFDASFYASIDELDMTLDFIFNCEEQGRGQLISARLEGYPCAQGPRDLEVPATTGSITRQDIVDACTGAT